MKDFLRKTIVVGDEVVMLDTTVKGNRFRQAVVTKLHNKKVAVTYYNDFGNITETTKYPDMLIIAEE